MAKVGLMVDDSGAFTDEDLKKAKVSKLIHTPYIINGEIYEEGENMSRNDFFAFLRNKNTQLSTSQPNIETIKDGWREMLKEFEQVVYVCLSSGLSEGCNTALNASHLEEFDGKVFVVNSQRISYMNKITMFEASILIDQGKTGKEIKEYLEQHRAEAGAYIAVDTLKYLKKGGRITPAVAMIGSILNIKPILQVHGGKLDAYSKVLSMRQAKAKIIQATRKEVEDRYPEELKQGLVTISIAHTFEDLDDKDLLNYKDEVVKACNDMKFYTTDSLPLFVACHTGPNALAVGYAIDRLGVREKFGLKD